MLRSLDRAAVVLRRDLTLGSLPDRLARIHGSTRLVEEADGGLCITHAQAAKRVRRWAGRIAQRTSPGDVVVIAVPNGYEQLLLCYAAARAGAIPAPVNDHMRPDEIEHVISDSGASLVIRGVGEVDGAEPLAEPHPADPRRRGRPLLHLGHHRQAQGGGPDPPCPRGSGLRGRPLAPAPAPRRGRGLAAGGPHHGLHRAGGPGRGRHPRLPAAAVQPGAGARRHRVPPGHRLHRRPGHVPDDGGGRGRRPGPHLHPDLGSRRRPHARRAGPAVQGPRRHRHPAR
jgi:hypothetical protein